jgi:hypothetical protein
MATPVPPRAQRMLYNSLRPYCRWSNCGPTFHRTDGRNCSTN